MFVRVLLLLFVSCQVVSAADPTADRAPTNARMDQITLDGIRCSIGVSKMGCTTVYLNCREGFFRCNGGGSGEIGGDFGGSNEISIHIGTDNGCTTNVTGKSCQDLLDIAIEANKGDTGLPADGGSVGTPGPTKPPAPIVGVTPSEPKKVPHSFTATTYSEAKTYLTSYLVNPKTGEKVWGLTTSSHATHWSAENGQLKVDTKLDTKVDMPEWSNIAAAQPPCLQDSWKRMYDLLWAHEMGHVAILNTWEVKLKEELAKLPSPSSPEFTSDKVDAAITEAWRRVNEENDKYEAENIDASGNVKGLTFDDCI